MSLTVEHDTERGRNGLKIVTDKTVEHLDFEDANDLLTDMADIVEKIELLEIERDTERFADEYGDANKAWRE